MRSGVTRRRFLGQGVSGVAALGVAGAATGAAAPKGREPVIDNPWRYDVDRMTQVDPALVHYTRVASFPLGGVVVRRIAVGPDGRIWVSTGKGVLGLSETGQPRDEFKTGEPVRGIHADPDGSLWLALRGAVERWSAEGRREWRSPAFAGKPFLTGVARSGEDLWVADSGNRVVYRCDLEGRVQVRLGEKNVERGIPGLVLPSPFLDVKVGVDGLLRVNNPGRHRVETYTRDGDLEISWGRPGVAIDSFCGCCNPVGFALLSDGRCVTAEKGLPRVKVYSATGALESVVAAPDSFAAVASDARGSRTADTTNDGLDVAVDPRGRVVVLDVVGATVQVFASRA